MLLETVFIVKSAAPVSPDRRPAEKGGLTPGEVTLLGELVDRLATGTEPAR